MKGATVTSDRIPMEPAKHPALAAAISTFWNARLKYDVPFVTFRTGPFINYTV